MDAELKIFWHSVQKTSERIESKQKEMVDKLQACALSGGEEAKQIKSRGEVATATGTPGSGDTIGHDGPSGEEATASSTLGGGGEVAPAADTGGAEEALHAGRRRRRDAEEQRVERARCRQEGKEAARRRHQGDRQQEQAHRAEERQQQRARVQEQARRA